jgi:hypothetical protein
VALLIAGWDRDVGPVLYHTDPSGTYVKYKCMAIGSGSEGALTALQVGRGCPAHAGCTVRRVSRTASQVGGPDCASNMWVTGS